MIVKYMGQGICLRIQNKNEDTRIGSVRNVRDWRREYIKPIQNDKISLQRRTSRFCLMPLLLHFVKVMDPKHLKKIVNRY